MRTAILAVLLASLSSSEQASEPDFYVPLADAPVTHIGFKFWDSTFKFDSTFKIDGDSVSLSSLNIFHSVGSFQFDTLRVVVNWGHPTDGLGNEDSTRFRIRSTKAIRFMGGGTLVVNTWRRRNHLSSRLADTFKVAMPAMNDSVMFNADSIQQCRLGRCSAPGASAWGYKRTIAPPSMTFIQVTVDSF